MSITLTISDELAAQLKPYESQFGDIMELGLREWQSRHDNGYSSMNDVLEKLAALPDPEEVLSLRPGHSLQERIESLLEKNHAVGLSADEQREWRQFEYVEHLVRVAKISAARKLQRTAS